MENNNNSRYLFRSKRIDNGEWVEGDLMQHYIHHEGFLTIVQNGCIYHKVEPETVGQWTGLVDKSGVKIWENDVFTCSNYTMYGGQYRVFWDEKYLCWCFGKHLVSPTELFRATHIKKIGNIFDNPDLPG